MPKIIWPGIKDIQYAWDKRVSGIKFEIDKENVSDEFEEIVDGYVIVKGTKEQFQATGYFVVAGEIDAFWNYSAEIGDSADGLVDLIEELDLVPAGAPKRLYFDDIPQKFLDNFISVMDSNLPKKPLKKDGIVRI